MSNKAKRKAERAQRRKSKSTARTIPAGPSSPRLAVVEGRGSPSLGSLPEYRAQMRAWRAAGSPRQRG